MREYRVNAVVEVNAETHMISGATRETFDAWIAEIVRAIPTEQLVPPLRFTIRSASHYIAAHDDEPPPPPEGES